MLQSCRFTGAMRSAIVIPLALSLALHAGLAWFASRGTLPRRDMPILTNLTIGLAVLPTTLAAPEALKAAEESAASAGPADIKSDTEPPSGRPVPAQEAQAVAAAAAQAEQLPTGKVAPDAPSETAAAAPVAQQVPIAPPSNNANPDPIAVATGEMPPGLAARGETSAATAPDVVASAPSPDVAPTSAPATDAMTLQDEGRIAAAPTEPVAESAAAAPVAAEASQSTLALSVAEPAIVASQAADAAIPQVDEHITAAQTGPVPEAPGAEPLAIASLLDVATQSGPASSVVGSATPPPQAQPPDVASEASMTAPLEVPEASAEAVASVEVVDPEAAATVRRAAAFIDRYDGGSCVYLSAERIDADVADVDGFATTADAFGQFHQAFAAAAGFEPAVTGQKIWKPQCPAVDVLRRLHAAHAVAPALHLDTVDVKGGGTLRGTIRDPLHRALHLYWITEVGIMRNVSARLATTDEGTRFTLDLDHRNASEPLPQMLLVLAGDAARPEPFPGEGASTALAGLLPTHGTGAPPGAAAKLFLLRD